MPQGATPGYGRLVTLLMLAISAAMAATIASQFYPGAMSPDSIAILAQARTGIFEDGHPPLLAYLWSVVDRVVPGPAGMLAVNLALFYGGIFLLFRWAARSCAVSAVVALVLVGLFPPLIGVIGVIWSDITLAGCLLAGFGLVLTATTMRGSRIGRSATLLAASLLLIAAVAVRHNGAAAAMPLVGVALLFTLPCPRPRVTVRRWLAVSVLAAGLTVVAFVAAQRVSAHAVDSPRHLWRVAAIYDIAGISHFERTFLFEPGILVDRSLGDIDVLYSPRSAAPLLIGEQIHALPGTQRRSAPPLNIGAIGPHLHPVLIGNWRQAIFDHPMSYLKHRAGVFESLITRSPWGLWGPVFGAIYPNDLGVPERGVLEGRYFQFLWNLATETPLFVPALYLMTALAIFAPTLVLALRWQRPMLLVAAGFYASGLFHMTGLFFTAASADFRYSHWMIVAIVNASVLVILDLAAFAFRDRRWVAPECEQPTG